MPGTIDSTASASSTTVLQSLPARIVLSGGLSSAAVITFTVPQVVALNQTEFGAKSRWSVLSRVFPHAIGFQVRNSFLYRYSLDDLLWLPDVRQELAIRDHAAATLCPGYCEPVDASTQHNGVFRLAWHLYSVYLL